MLLLSAARPISAASAAGVIHNDTVWRDTSEKEIWCNGGDILREDGVFYWVGYDTGPGRWPWQIRLYSSCDLADWKFENTVIRREGKFGSLGWAGRPGLLHCRTTGKYVILFEADSPQQWQRHKVGFAACDRIDGPYELVNLENPEGTRSTGDQSVYQEGEKAYLLATMDKDIAGRKYLNQSLAIFELSPDFLRLERKLFEGFDNVNGDPNVAPRDHASREACHVIKRGGIYYWFSSGLVGWNSSATMYATATNLAGPWSELRLLRTDPPSPDSYNTQHDFVLPVVGTEATTWVYVGDRYSQWTKRGPGRNLFLPLVWENDEPLLRWLKDWSLDPITGRFQAQALAASTPDLRPNLCVEVTVAPGPAWTRHVIDNTSRGADGVKTGDLNGDGRTDFVTGWEEGGVVRVYLHPGRSRVREPWPRVTVGNVRDAEDAIFADLDRDGRLEVVSCAEGKTRTVYWHRCAGGTADLENPDCWSTVAFPATVQAQAWMQAVAVDLDGQHGIDLVLGSKNAGATIGWLQAPADPLVLSDWTFHRLREAGWIMSLEAYDLDGDKDSDLLCSDRKGGRSSVSWLENPGAAANRQHAPWREHVLGALGREVMFLDVGDLNGDGHPDVAAAVKPCDILFWLRQPDNGWREQTLPLAADNLGDAKAVKIADLNGDGLADLLFTCENAKGAREGLVWLEQGAAGGPWKQRSLGGPEGLKFDLLQVLDLDGNGDLDVVTCEEADELGVVWYENPSLLDRRDF